MFPLKVTEELVHWPEMDVRERRWVSQQTCYNNICTLKALILISLWWFWLIQVSVEEAREGCDHIWMKEALDRLVRRLSLLSRAETTKAASSQCSVLCLNNASVLSLLYISFVQKTNQELPKGRGICAILLSCMESELTELFEVNVQIYFILSG